MAGKFELRRLSELNLRDPFFDSLKSDYPETSTHDGFEKWYHRKAVEDRRAMVFEDDYGIGAFLCLKSENEEIRLRDKTLPQKKRLKISTFKISERYARQRLGEGALGLALWTWQDLKYDEVYVTIFRKQVIQIRQLVKFGFNLVGYNLDGECVYIKSRQEIDYSDPYRSFPFINPAFQHAGYLIIEDHYHDTLFPYSELKQQRSTKDLVDATNGLSKIYVGSPLDPYPYKRGEPVFIYRQFTGDGQRNYKSCVTTYCVVNAVTVVKEAGKCKIPLEEYFQLVGNKSVFKESDLQEKYMYKSNLAIVELVYYRYFGAGNNINRDWLIKNGFWGKGYPTGTRLSPEQFAKIIQEGSVDVKNVIIN